MVQDTLIARGWVDGHRVPLLLAHLLLLCPLCVLLGQPPAPTALGLCQQSLVPRALPLVMMVSLMASRACYNSPPCMQSLAMPHLCWSLGHDAGPCKLGEASLEPSPDQLLSGKYFHAHSGEREQFPDAGGSLDLFNLSTQHQLFNDGGTHTASPS